MDSRAAKAQLRTAMKAARAGVSATDHLAAADAACSVVRALPAWQDALVVCLYASFKSELGTQPLLLAALAEGKTLLLPRARPDGTLGLHRVDNLNQLAASQLGIPEPLATCPVGVVGSVNFFLVPGLAFDVEGRRLGYGAGFYDRLLHGATTQALLVGYGFAFQVTPEVPVEAHDRNLHAIATPAGLIHRVTR